MNEIAAHFIVMALLGLIAITALSGCTVLIECLNRGIGCQ